MGRCSVPKTPIATVTLWTLYLAALQVSRAADIDDVNIFEHEHFSKTSLLGGRNGGTRVVLLGSDLMNADGSFDHSISVTVGGYAADVIPFLSTPEKIVFESPAVPEHVADCCHAIVVRIT